MRARFGRSRAPVPSTEPPPAAVSSQIQATFAATVAGRPRGTADRKTALRSAGQDADRPRYRPKVAVFPLRKSPANRRTGAGAPAAPHAGEAWQVKRKEENRSVPLRSTKHDLHVAS